MPTTAHAAATLVREVLSEAIQVQWEAYRELLTALPSNMRCEVGQMVGVDLVNSDHDDFESNLDEATQALFMSNSLPMFPQYRDTANMLLQAVLAGEKS